MTTPLPPSSQGLADGTHLLDRASVLQRFGDGRDLPCLDPWRDLVDQALVANAFLVPEVLLPALNHLADDRVALVVVVRDGHWRALAPVRCGAHFRGHPVRASVSWEHAQAFLGTPLVRRDASPADWSALVDGVASTGDAWWVLSLLDVEVAARLETAAGARAYETARLLPTDRGATPCPEDPADLVRVPPLTAARRRNLRRVRRRLEEELGGAVALEGVGGPDDPDHQDEQVRVRSAAGAFLTMEDSGWKGPDGGAMARRPAEAAFFLDACEHGSARGTVRLLRLQGAERGPAALAALLHAGDTVSWWKIAHDPALGNRSPGLQMAVGTFDLLAEPSVRLIDSCTDPASRLGNELHTDRRHLTVLAIALGPRRGSLAVRGVRRWVEGRRRSAGLASSVRRGAGVSGRLRRAREGSPPWRPGSTSPA